MISDIWQKLAGQDKPIVLYGMGNGADKILSVFERYGIKASGIFASDGFVRDKYFHGMRLDSYGGICEKFSDFTVVVSFASHLPEVIENVNRISHERELVIPEVPVVADAELFNIEFYEKNKFEISKARELFAFLIDRRGSGVTARQACTRLWEEGDDARKMNYFYQLVDDLRYSLRNAGAESVLVKNGNNYAVDVEQLDCDYLKYLRTGKPEFCGEYMSQYSWAEETCALLFRKGSK